MEQTHVISHLTVALRLPCRCDSGTVDQSLYMSLMVQTAEQIGHGRKKSGRVMINFLAVRMAASSHRTAIYLMILPTMQGDVSNELVIRHAASWERVTRSTEATFALSPVCSIIQLRAYDIPPRPRCEMSLVTWSRTLSGELACSEASSATMYSYGYHEDGYDSNGMGQTEDGSPGNYMLGQDVAMTGGQSLDEIVNQSAKIIGRQSMPPQQLSQQYSASPSLDQSLGADVRQGTTMMDFGGTSPVVQTGPFQFNSNIMDQGGGMMVSPMQMQMSSQTTQMPQAQSSTSHRGSADNSQPSGDLTNLNNNYTNNYNPMRHSSGTFSASPAHQRSSIDMNMGVSQLNHNLGLSMEYGADQDMNTPMSGGGINMDMFSPAQYSNQMMNSPMQQAPSHGVSQGSNVQQRQMSQESASRSASIATGQLHPPSRTHSMHTNSEKSPTQLGPALNVSGSLLAQQIGHNQFQTSSPQQNQAHNRSLNSDQYQSYQQQQEHSRTGSAQDHDMQQTTSDAPSTGFDGINGPVPINLTSYNPNNQGFQWETPEGGWPSTLVGRPHAQSTYKNAYSSTGFDMLGVLMRVATRPNPQINIGAVDLSCAFVVCDAEKDDTPIVYCSDNFERLTGYTKHMILGRNCRFLQSPDGQVSPGIRRKYVDDDSVLYLKNMTNLQREAQISLINYRRGGQPFMNLLTMIPITWDSDKIKFFVGFQVDLVEQPNAVTDKNADGSYSINYQRGMAMPPYVMPASESVSKTELGQTVSREDVSTLLSTVGNGESEYAKRIWDKVLLENTDDVVHVLSLKGLFLWISPSSARVLEYEPSELMGTALSSVCHPSDIVPVTRELKDTSSAASVNVVFRIRRKVSGYMWFEGHGSLHTEQGKGRKSIIMVGRERPVYTLSKKDLEGLGGIGESELWSKISTSGMFLFVSSNVRQLLDRQPDELVGISIQTLMRSESKADFGRILEHARTGMKASVKHEMINRRGQVLSAYTTVYPGDAQEGQKPTFVLAQTRLIKFSRGAQMVRNNSGYSKSERNPSESALATGTISARQGGSGTSPNSAVSSRHYRNTDGTAATYAGQFGLVIGHQDQSLASEDNLFDELKTTKSSSWQYEIRQLEKRNRILAEEVQSLIAAKKKRKRRKGAGNMQKDCANCHTKVTPEWRRGPSGQRDLCNSCGLRWAKINGRVSPRTNSVYSSGAASDKASKASASPLHQSSVPSQQQQQQQQQQPSPFGSTTVVKSEFPTPAPTPSAVPTSEGQEGQPPPSKAVRLSGDHSASMEGASGVPDSIREDVEPD
nr:white collar 1 protein [Quercus suber]